MKDDLGLARCRQAEGIIHRERGNYPGAKEANSHAQETGERLSHPAVKPSVVWTLS
jgi:hypothetical protein